MAEPLILTGWHASREPIKELHPFLHVGTENQARMRGKPGDALHEMRFRTDRPIRKIDTGSWSRDQLLRLQRHGYDAVIYLNRWEGLPLAEVEAAIERNMKPEKLSDAQFRKAFPSAADSWIIFSPAQIEIISTNRIERKQSPAERKGP